MPYRSKPGDAVIANCDSRNIQWRSPGRISHDLYFLVNVRILMASWLKPRKSRWLQVRGISPQQWHQLHNLQRPTHPHWQADPQDTAASPSKRRPWAKHSTSSGSTGSRQIASTVRLREDASDTRLSQCEHAHRTITTQAHQYSARTYLQGMGSWLPPLSIAENRDTFDQGNDCDQSHRTIQASFEGQLLSFGLSGHSFSMYRRVTASIRLLWDVPLNITLFMMALYSCVFEISFTKARKSRRLGFFENRVWLGRATVFGLSGAFFVSSYQGMKIWCGFTYSWLLRRWTQAQNDYELWLHL